MKYYNRERNILTGLYDQTIRIAGDKMEADFSKADFLPKKKQKEIRKEINRFYDENVDLLSDANRDKISPQTKLSCIFTFLDAINKESVDADRSRRDDWLAFAAECKERSKNILTRISDEAIYGRELNDLKIVDGKVKWCLAQSDSFEQILYLLNPVFSENYNSESLHSYPEISETENGYVIEFIQSDYDETDMTYINERISSLTFSSMELDTVCFDYTKPPVFFYEPWTAIYKYLLEIENKNNALGETFLNNQEKALLPLAEFIPFHDFSGCHVENIGNGNIAAVELFISLAKETGNQKIVDLSEKYLKYIEDYKINASDSDDTDESHLKYTIRKEEKRLSKKITLELKTVESEPLFRFLLKRIKEAAAEYPIKIERDVSAEELSAMRTRIAEQMREKGFEGEYPHFKKMSPLKGVKILEINGQPILVCKGKNMVSCIDCFEDFYCDRIIVSYSVSTIFLRKRQIDLYNNLNGDSGFFIDKHCRRARYVMFHNVINDLPGFDLQKSMEAAIKTSQCEKLTKSERKEYAPVGPGKDAISLLAVIWLIAGAVFGLMWCIGMVISLFVILLIESRALEDAWKMVIEAPWLSSFLACFFGFGGLLFLIMLIGMKKGK